MKLLLIIDLQNEFINESTEYLIEKIQKLRESGEYDKTAFTRFINGRDNPTYKMGWHGCMNEESRAICLDPNDDIVIDKETYSAYNEELINYLKKSGVDEIVLCGIDIDCCVLATAINLFENDYNVYVLKDYVGCMLGEKAKNNAIDIIKRNIGEKRVI